MDEHAVGGEHGRGLPREEVGFDAAVMRDGARGGLFRAKQEVGKTLGRPADGVNIQAVGACADDAAHAAGAELQLAVETVFDFSLLALDRPQLLLQIGVLDGMCKPCLLYTSTLVAAPALVPCAPTVMEVFCSTSPT